MVKSYIFQAWKLSKGVRRSLGMHLLASTCHVMASLGFVWACKQLIDVATGTVEGSLTLYAWLLTGVIVLQLTFTGIKNWLAAYCDIAVRNTLRKDLFVSLTHAEQLSRRMHTGEIVNRLDNDVRIVGEALGTHMPLFVGRGLQFAVSFSYLYTLNHSLAWVLLFIMPVCLVISKLVIRTMREQTMQIREAEGKIQTHLQENIQHLTLLQTLESEQRAAQTLHGLQDTLYRRVARQARFTVTSRMIVNTAFAMGYLTAFLWGVYGIHSGTVSFGTMTAFLQLAAQIQNPLAEMGRHLPALIHATASIDRLDELSDGRREEEKRPRVLMSGRAGVRLEEVSFRYPDGDQDVFHHFSYDFRPGSRTAIVGESGIGKSTLVRLMLALFHPQEGKVLLYDENREVCVGPETRGNFVYVPQGNTLLSGTIRENLSLGNPQASEADMWEVLRVAEASFVADLPAGLDTPCRELGVGLSEGQAQRIAIARALLRKGKILLLDEITASLDAETERRLLQNLMAYCTDCTLLFITHRACLVDYCDSVLRLGDS